MMSEHSDDWIPMEVWMPHTCPKCKYSSVPLDEKAPCENCEMGSKFDSNPREPSPNEKRIADLESQRDELLAAIERQVANIERWQKAGIPAGPEESKEIYDQMKSAINRVKLG